MRLKDLTGPHARDLTLSALGQGGSALLTLLYLRLAVRGFTPEAYGMASAWIGAHQLLRGLLLLPLLQLLLFRFHAHEAGGSGPSFSVRLLHLVVLFSGLITLFALLGLALFPPTARDWLQGGFLVGLLGLAEGLKGFSLNHLNLQERHGRYAAAMVGDAALRLALLHLVLPCVPARPEVLLAVPILGSTLVTLVLGCRHLPWAPPLGGTAALLREHAHFLLPVAGFAITAWATGLSDRYFLLHWAGPKDTGIYAAVYGIFGTPFPLLAATLTQVFRPRLSSLLARGSGTAYTRAYRQFFGLGLSGAAILALGLWSLRLPIAHLMLRQEHLPLLHDLPWLLAGQVAMVFGLLFELEFFVQNQIRLVALKQGVGMFSALVFMAILIPQHGMRGAMIACACYFAAESLTALFLRIRPRNAHQPGSNP